MLRQNKLSHLTKMQSVNVRHTAESELFASGEDRLFQTLVEEVALVWSASGSMYAPKKVEAVLSLLCRILGGLQYLVCPLRTVGYAASI